MTFQMFVSARRIDAYMALSEVDTNVQDDRRPKASTFASPLAEFRTKISQSLSVSWNPAETSDVDIKNATFAWSPHGKGNQ